MVNEGFHAAVLISVIAILARYFSIEKFGDYAFILAFCGIFQVATDMGVNQIVVREIARKKEMAPEIFGASLFLRFIFSLVTLGLIALLINLLSSSREVIQATYVCAFGLVSLFFYNLVLAVFQGYERMQFVTIVGVITRASHLALILTFVWLGADLKGIFLPRLISSGLGFTLGCYLMSRFFFTPNLRVDFSLCWSLIKESYLLGIGRIFRQTSLRIDTVLLKFLRSSAEAGLFQGVYRPILALMFIPRNISAALFPVFSRLFEERSDSFENIYRDAFKLFTIIMLPVVITMIFLSKEFVTLLLGERFLPAVPAFRILCMVWGLMSLSVLSLRILTAINRQHLVTLCIGIALIINIVLDLILIPQRGFMGAAWATLFAEVGLIVASFLCVTKHVSYLSPWRILYGPCSGGLLMALFCLLLADSSILPKMLLILPSGILIYFAYMVLTKTLAVEEYQYIKDFFKSVRWRA